MEGFGWEYREVNNGHNINELLQVFSDVRERASDKPLCIGARTIKGHGVPFLTNKPWLHGQTPSGEEGELLVNLLKEEKYGLE
jgi:transketolase